jgi:hypothetical protein
LPGGYSKHHSKIYVKGFALKTDRILGVAIHSGQNLLIPFEAINLERNQSEWMLVSE